MYEINSYFQEMSHQNMQHGQIYMSGEQSSTDSGSDVAVVNARPKLKKPPLYAVVLLNDDITPMDFVVDILQQYFALTGEQATEVMLKVHYEGKGVAGIYTKDIAQTKANQVNQHARVEGYPLTCQIELHH